MSNVIGAIDLLVIPCFCPTYLGTLPAVAATLIAERPGVHCLRIMEEEVQQAQLRQAMAVANRTIGVDGCEKKCIRQALRDCGLESEFHLVLTDLGLEDQVDCQPAEEDLTLARDGILAEATRVSSKFPRFPGCCC